MVNCNYRSKIHKTFYPSVNNSIPLWEEDSRGSNSIIIYLQLVNPRVKIENRLLYNFIGNPLSESTSFGSYKQW